MLSSTTFDIPGYEITEHRGLVRGIIVRSPTISQGILGGLNNIIGGKIGAYTKMCEQTRPQVCADVRIHKAKPSTITAMHCVAHPARASVMTNP